MNFKLLVLIHVLCLVHEIYNNFGIVIPYKNKVMILKITSKFIALLNLNKIKIIKTSILVFFISFSFIGYSQILINEASNKNFNQIFDEDNENEDWIELFNSGDNAINIGGWSITDNDSKVTKWVFPNLEMAPKSHLLIFASGKDRNIVYEDSKWESAILPADTFSYVIPDANVPSNWNTLAFDASLWNTGVAGFGYGDDDDTTVLPTGTIVTYIRKNFMVTDLDAIITGICHVDYDDGFVAYINGIEICRGNLTGTPTWNSGADGNHEAVIKDGGIPEGFSIDPNELQSILQEGENVFSIEVHNVDANSSDLSLSPYLSFLINEDDTFFSESPEWVSNNNDAYLHTNFKISGEGETIYLYDDTQELIDVLEVDIETLNYSYGREQDGASEYAIFVEATPGLSNNNVMAYVDGYEDMPLFNIPAGYHNNTINVSLTSPSTTSIIRYTLDGSEPIETSTLYDGTAITLSESITINAKAFSTTTKLPSLVNTSTYIVNETFSVPVLSVTTDESNLFGDDGIFTNNQESWNRPCYIEYFEADGTLAFSQKSGIQVDGGAGGSRTQPQTSFRIEPGNGTFGDGDLNYNIHPNRPNRTNYESLYLRNGSNRYLDLFYKDAAQVRGMGQNTHNFYSEYRPIVVFINGGYYGMYEGREKINEDYLKSNYNMDTGSLNMVGISHFNEPRTILPLVGSVEPFFEDYERFLNMDTSSETYLEEVGTFLDLDNYTDYMAGQTWMTNKDWPHNNLKSWRCEGSGMRWQFAIMDLEWSFLPTGNSANLRSLPDFDQIQFMNDNGTDWPASGYWYMLMQNDDYKYHFINRLCDLMNTSYAYEELSKIETEMFEEAWPEIPAYYERWNGGNPSEFQSNHETFNSQLGIREVYLRQHLRDHYSLNNDVEINLDVVGPGKVKISTITPEEYPWDGDYFSDVPITIEAVPNQGYKFVKWQTNSLIEDLTKADFTVVLGTSTNVSFVAEFEVDTAPFTDITITEINYKEGDDFNTTDWFEIYNGTSNVLSLDGWYFSDSDSDHRYDFDSQVEIQPNGYLAVAKTIDRFIENYPSVSNIVGGFDFGLGSNDAIKLYNANDELIVEVEYSDDAPWPLNGDDTGRTLELLNYTKELSDPLAWFKGCFKGSPGTEYDDNCEDDLLIDEYEITERKIVAFPIPAEDQVNLSIDLPQAEQNINIEIYDLLGRLVKKIPVLNLNTGSNTISVDLIGLKDQLYILTLNGSSWNHKIKLIKK